MRRTGVAICLLLAAAPVLSAQKNAAKISRPPAQVKAPPAARAPKAGGKLLNPGNVADRLARMTPEERERALEKLPPERQAQIRQRLERFDNLPEQERVRRLQLYDRFAGLSPEKQDLVRRQIQAFNRLPDDRRPIVRAEIQRLSRMPESERQGRIASEEFKSKFSPAEQQMLSDISGNMPLGQP
jgi:hypothetical protein